MPGETDINQLLASLAPSLMNGEYVFCTFEHSRYGDHAEFEPVGSFSETEGLTLIVPLAKAIEHNLSYEAVYKGITLGVHSSLDAVGLTAAFSNKLAEAGISANVFAGHYHDHLFVRTEHAKQAVDVLIALQATAVV